MSGDYKEQERYYEATCGPEFEKLRKRDVYRRLLENDLGLLKGKETVKRLSRIRLARMLQVALSDEVVFDKLTEHLNE